MEPVFEGIGQFRLYEIFFECGTYIFRYAGIEAEFAVGAGVR
jgi:hypothetical protein